MFLVSKAEIKQFSLVRMKCMIVAISLMQICNICSINRVLPLCRSWLSPDPSLIGPCHLSQAVWMKKWRAEQSDLMTLGCGAYRFSDPKFKIFDKLQSDPVDWMPICSCEVLEAILEQSFQFNSEFSVYFRGFVVPEDQ